MGVLVGTSLIVIIPEGIETIYSAKPAVGAIAEVPQLRGRATVAGGNIWERDDDRLDLDDSYWGGDIASSHANHAHAHGEGGGEGETEHNHGAMTPPSETAHKWVGLSLISGFILMYLIDVIPSHAHSHTTQTYHIEIDNLRSLSASSSPLDGPSTAHVHSRASATTFGLVVHAAADGIALGASSTSSNAALEAIVFLAIMLHKAPAAFGLSAVLLRAGLGKRQARGHLIVFSLAAPVGAIVTWALLNILGGAGADGEGIQWWTGVLLLFSGGTFL
jgi:zinc transporter 9